MKGTSTKPKSQRFWDVAIKIGVLISCITILGVYVYGQFFVEGENLYANECKEFNEPWWYTDHDGIMRSYHSGDTIEIEDGEDVAISVMLPDELGDGNCLFIRSSRSFDAYIGDDLRNSYDISDSIFGPNVKPIWLAITLRRSDVGKTLTIIHDECPGDTYKISDVYFGNRLGFSMQLIHDNIYVIIISFALIILGLVVAGICLLSRIREKRELTLWHLSLGVFLGALWLIFNNYAYPLLFGTYFVDGIVSYMIILILPCAFVAYIRALLGEGYRVPYTVISILNLVAFWVLTILDFTYVADFYKTLSIDIAIICFSAIFCLGAIVYDSLIKKNRRNRLIAFGFAAFVVMGIAEAIHLNIPIHDNNGVFIALGFLILLACAALREIRAISMLRAEMLEAREANRAKSDFLANMSHEIRTPMNAVIGMTEIAMREDLPPNARDCLEQIKKSGNNLLNIINDILDYSKIDSGKMEIIPERYEPLSELNDISNILITRVGEKDLELYVVTDLDIPHALYGDPGRIRQILINLINNAIKFTKKGRVSVIVSCQKKDDDTVNLTYHIKDTGVGIKEEDMAKLFNSFTQVDSKRNRTEEGTGLGLAISQRLVEAMGGEIGVNSVYGEGSDFWFTIPQKVIDPAQDVIVEDIENKKAIVLSESDNRIKMFKDEMKRIGVENAAIRSLSEYVPSGKKDYLYFASTRYDEVRALLIDHPEVTGAMFVDYDSVFRPDVPNLHMIRRPISTIGMVRALNDAEDLSGSPASEEAYSLNYIAPDARILVVDDNAINITIVEGLLAPMQIQIDSALSGEEAIEKVKKNDYDIVLMDHMMPVMDGIDTTRAIREDIPGKEDLVIIALSANALEEARKQFEEAGMNDFIAKPIEIKELVNKLRKWLPAEKIHRETAADEGGTASDAARTVYEGLDSEQAIRILGSAALYDRIVGEYYRSGADKLEGIRSAYEKEDISDYTIRVHALKSSSRQIGAVELGDIAEKLENAGKAGDVDTINELTDGMLTRFSDLLDSLKDHFAEDASSETEKIPIEESVLKEQLDKLTVACDDLDMDAMEEVEMVLKQYSYPDDKKELMEKLYNAIENIDVDSVTQIVADLVG